MRAHPISALLLLLWLAACGREPDFDERYAKQQEQLEKEAHAMDAELQRRITAKPGVDAADAEREVSARQ